MKLELFATFRLVLYFDDFHITWNVNQVEYQSRQRPNFPLTLDCELTTETKS